MLYLGYFIFFVYLLILHNQVLGSCQPSCSECSGSGNSQTCVACNYGNRLADNGYCYPCPGNCEHCTSDSTCTKCKPGYWDLRSQINCGSHCRETCTSSGCEVKTAYCLGCHPGFYGPYCDRNCSLCINRNCNREQCIIGCNVGYYESTENIGFKCKKCSAHCSACASLTNCTQCKRGFYLFSYENSDDITCSPCNPSCEECITYNECVCHTGKYGPTCSKDCNIPNCKSCTEVDSVVNCTECINGYTVTNGFCFSETNPCSQYCSNGCDISQNCLGDCQDGWTGSKCSEGCANQCRKCAQNDGKNCEICEGDFYTSTCNVSCSIYCADLPGLPNCNIYNGTCLNGCDKGYWGAKCGKTCYGGCNSDSCNQSYGFCDTCYRTHYGDACQSKCSEHCREYNGSSTVCFKSNGTCANGCKDGYGGNTCEDKLLVVSTLLSSSVDLIKTTTVQTELGVTEKQRDIIVIAAGAGGGVLVIVILVVIVVCIVKRQRKKNSGSNGDDNGQINRQHPLGDSDNVYAQPNKVRKEQSQDYIYAQPNKPKKIIHHKKEEISVPKRAYDNVVIDLDTDGARISSGGTDSEETDVDAILLENIDDEPKSVIVIEVNVAASDTYYNMAGLLRSRVLIPKLFEYMKNKNDFEADFEKLPKGLTRTCNEALKPNNRAKNRYNGIYAYDATRVVLRSKNFINANYVDSQGQLHISYIASLGPTRSTMHNFATFWEMVWQEESNTIVMLTNLKESEKMKCEQYWPNRGSRNRYGNMSVTGISEKVFSDFVVRELTVEQNSESRMVTQYHYTAWPDKSVPHNIASLIEFRDKVEQRQTPLTGRMIVHCSAGIGRTGTYIALDILIREGKEENYVDIFGCVIALRGQRVNLVQNVEQYIFLHHSVLYALTCEPDIYPVTAIPHVLTDDRVATQHQSFQNIETLTNRNKLLRTQVKGRKENRRGADIPDEEHRVRLTLTKHDYINAVYVNGYEETDKFILAQTPLPNTLEDFVSMLYQERCSSVVCLDEENIKDETAAKYIPPANKVSTFGHFQVACTKSDPWDDFIIRELKISQIGSPSAKDFTVRHYQFKGWNNSDLVPKKVSSFLNTILDVGKMRKSSHPKHPIVVHCLTGSVRSGLFCVVYILLEKMAVENELSVLNTICQVRSRRKSAIQDIEQLQLCYNSIEEMLEMPDSNTYCNISNV